MREFETSQRLLRFGFEAGPERVVAWDIEFVQKDPSSITWSSGNYDIIWHRRYGLGGVFVAKLEFRSGKSIGFDIELFTHQNKYRSTTGVSFGICIGMVGK
jgi:hypothetical protein